MTLSESWVFLSEKMRSEVIGGVQLSGRRYGHAWQRLPRES